MTCTHPIYLKKEKIFVPCTKCTSCRIAHAREWATRILNEAGYYPFNLFITLTYDDLHLPANKSLEKTCLQNFFKRFRQVVPRKIKYYACGEYGEIKQRPHYHIIMFNAYYSDFKKEGSYYDPPSKKYIDYYSHPAWMKNKEPMGYINLGTVTYDSARYVADYTNKSKYYGQMAKDIYGEREHPFTLQSTGLGKQYCLDNKEKLLQKLGDTIHGANVGLPKYYRKILGVTGEEMHEASKEYEKTPEEVLKQQQMIKIREIFDKPYTKEETDKIESYYSQIEKNQKARTRNSTRQKL